MFHRSPWQWVILWFTLLPLPAPAEDIPPKPVEADRQLLKPEALEALVAPIALYPDTLLAEVLMASTYPLEVVEAERWLSKHKQLNADQLKAELGKTAWDGSVKSLIATPSVLEMMSEQLTWTQKLGDAVLAQQGDVMDAVQRVRERAYKNQKLSSNNQQTVTIQQETNKNHIVIEPATADVISVPYYDPAVVYGEWPYLDDPPYYFGGWGDFPPAVLGSGIAFGAGYLLGRWTSGGNYWGGGIHWGGGNIDINRPIDGGRHRVTHWQHDPLHRRGVGYSNDGVRQKFADRNPGTRPAGRAADRAGNRSPNAGKAAAKSRTRQAGASKSRTASARRAPAHRRQASTQARHRAQAGRVRAQHRSASFARARPSGAHFRGAGRPARFAGGGFRGGGFRGGGGRGGAFRGGRRSDIRLKDDVALLRYLDSGIGYYRFRYHGSDKIYVGVIAQEMQTVAPRAVAQGRDGYLRVAYGRLGLKMQTFDQWIASGARIPHR